MDNVEMLLEFVYHHPHSYQLIPTRYRNALAMSLADTLILPNPDTLFPPNALDAIRLPDDFASANPKVTAWLAKLVNPDNPPQPNELWLTTGYSVAAKRLYLEVSFE